MRKRLLFLAIVMCVAGLAVLTATGVSEQSSTKQFEFMFCSPKTDDPIWLVAKQGFDDAAQDFGFKAVWTGALDHSVEGTVQALENTIASAPDGIIACAIAPPAFATTLQKAVDNNIPLVALILKPTSKALRTAWIGADFKNAGLTAVKQIHKALGTDSVKIGGIMSNLDVEIQIEQLDSARAYLSKFPNAGVIEVIEDHADPSESYSRVKDLLTAFPEINALQSTESGGTPGVGRALHELGLSEKVVAVCSDDTDINLDTLRKGWIHGLTAQDFWAMGYLAGKYLFMVNNGMDIPDETDTGVLLVTRDNIDTYAVDRDAEHARWRAEAPELLKSLGK